MKLGLVHVRKRDLENRTVALSMSYWVSLMVCSYSVVAATVCSLHFRKLEQREKVDGSENVI